MKKITRKQLLIVLISIVVIVGTGILARFFFFGTVKPADITVTAEKMDIEEKVLASGSLTAFKTVDVGAQVSGQLKSLHVALGDKVKKGQLLAEIDPVLQVNSLRDAEAQVESLKAQSLSKQAILKQYELAWQRQKQMVSQDAAAIADLENARALLDSTLADIASLDAQLKKADIAVDTAKANFDYTRIMAPMDGVVISIVTEEGQTVVSAQSAITILKLANLDTITVKAQISEADIARVKPGQTVYFTTLGDADTRHYSKLRAIEPGPDAGSVSSAAGTSSASGSTAIYYNGLFDVPNPENRLRVSMTAQVAIVLSTVKQVLCIPVSALGEKRKDGRYSVKVQEGGKVVSRTIRIGVSDNVSVQVLDGLREGSKVVVGDSSTLPAPVGITGSGPPPGGGQ